MNIPKLIKISSRDVKVIIGSLPDNLMGQFVPDTQTITLNKNLSKVLLIETFWHELIHAINDYNRVTVEIATEIENNQEAGNTTEQAYNLEERMTENFAKVFLQVITDNELLGINVK